MSPLAQYQAVDDLAEREYPPVTLVPAQFIVHCVAERKEGYWQAFSLEFGLAAQGDSLPDVRHRLDSMITSYVFDALAGEDREHAPELLKRKATLGVYAKYYLAEFRSRLARVGGGSRDRILFSEPLRLRPDCLA